MRRFLVTVTATVSLFLGGLGLQPATADGYPPCTTTGTDASDTITGTEGNDVEDLSVLNRVAKVRQNWNSKPLASISER